MESTAQREAVHQVLAEEFDRLEAKVDRATRFIIRLRDERQELKKRLCALFQAGQRRQEFRSRVRIEPLRDRVAILDKGEKIFQAVQKLQIARSPDVVAVQGLELGQVEARRRAAD